MAPLSLAQDSSNSVKPTEGATKEQAKAGRFLHEVIRTSPPHQNALLQALRGQRHLPNWVRNMVATPFYVSSASVAVTIDGVMMEAFGACLAGDCANSHLRVLFQPDGKFASMRIVDAKMGEIIVGTPSPQALAELARPGL
ncbi:Ivy family c-type lysozyme inhibitor [Rhizobium helianthi]|uniref:Ivy family c-type lysozyme inhibitor n=1 Tax=Rhizobium helianthi TaxID=1132695 RepID=A0ABW4M334_9HYPH